MTTAMAAAPAAPAPMTFPRLSMDVPAWRAAAAVVPVPAVAVRRSVLFRRRRWPRSNRWPPTRRRPASRGHGFSRSPIRVGPAAFPVDGPLIRCGDQPGAQHRGHRRSIPPMPVRHGLFTGQAPALLVV